jgi:protocatechuate 3,4-dioxygenase beta subunit
VAAVLILAERGIYPAAGPELHSRFIPLNQHLAAPHFCGLKSALRKISNCSLWQFGVEMRIGERSISNSNHPIIHMNSHRSLPVSTSLQDRRGFLLRLGLGSALFTVPGAFAEELVRTPAQTEGPFYPDKLPLDTDNDLLMINDGITPAVGEVTWLSGRVLDARGEPIRNALVEIWQCDNNGAYLHSGTGNKEKQDKHFQGFGRFLTGSTGEYLFRTIKPVPYPGRTPHIHYAIKMKGRKELVTQCYIEGHPANEKDGVYKGIRDEKARKAVSIPWLPLKGSRAGELTARFDVVLGLTPEL